MVGLRGEERQAHRVGCTELLRALWGCVLVSHRRVDPTPRARDPGKTFGAEGVPSGVVVVLLRARASATP